HRSPVGTVLVAIRENEERARFVGYPTNRYKLIAFTLSATVVAAAGTLSVFNHRFASAEPLSVAFSGALVAMVVIGGMRSFLGPALGARVFRRSAQGAAAVLVADGMVKRFGGIHAVDGVSLAVKDRTLHALIGPNGAGKTTAFNLVSGLFPPDAGTIALDGRSIAGLKPEDITAAGVGRSFQITNLFGGLSAAAVTEVNEETAALIDLLG